MNRNIAVIGAGNGGRAMAAHFARCGASVSLCDPFPEYINDIKEEGGIHLQEEENYSEFIPLAKISTSIRDTIKNANLTMVVTPAFTHGMIADACCDYLEDGQIIILNPGRTAGAFHFLKQLREKGCSKKVIVAETQSLIYSCRRLEGTKVKIYGTKDKLDIASIPANQIDTIIDCIGSYYPQFQPAKNTLWTGFANLGAMFHPLPILLNTGRIETDKNGFKYYIEGISPTVASMIEKLDNERLSVADAFGVDILDVKSWLQQSYKSSGNNLYENIQSNAAYNQIMAPSSLNVRYLSDDVPSGLVPISELGKTAGIETPVLDAVITLCSNLCNCNYRETGRSLKNLGLENQTIEQVIHLIEQGI